VLVESERARMPFVRLDVEAGLDLLFDHLVELGHRRIGYVQSAIEGQTFVSHNKINRINGLSLSLPPMRRADRSSESLAESGLSHPRGKTFRTAGDTLVSRGVTRRANLQPQPGPEGSTGIQRRQDIEWVRQVPIRDARAALARQP